MASPNPAPAPALSEDTSLDCNTYFSNILTNELGAENTTISESLTSINNLDPYVKNLFCKGCKLFFSLSENERTINNNIISSSLNGLLAHFLRPITTSTLYTSSDVNTQRFIMAFYINLVICIYKSLPNLTEDHYGQLINLLYDESDTTFEFFYTDECAIEACKWSDIGSFIFYDLQSFLMSMPQSDYNVFNTTNSMLLHSKQNCIFNGSFTSIFDGGQSSNFLKSIKAWVCSLDSTQSFCPITVTCPAPSPSARPQPQPQPAPAVAPKPPAPKPTQCLSDGFGIRITKTNLIVRSITFRNKKTCENWTTRAGEYGDLFANEDVDGTHNKHIYKTTNNKYFIVAKVPSVFINRKIYTIYPIEITNNCIGVSPFTINRRIFMPGATTVILPTCSPTAIEGLKNGFQAHLTITTSNSTTVVTDLALGRESSLSSNDTFYNEILYRLFSDQQFVTPNPFQITGIPTIHITHRYAVSNDTIIDFNWTSLNAIGNASITITPSGSTMMTQNLRGYNGSARYRFINTSTVNEQKYTISVTTIVNGKTVSSSVDVFAYRRKAKGGRRTRKNNKKTL